MTTETTAQVGPRVTVEVPKRPTMYTYQFYKKSAKKWVLGFAYHTKKDRDKVCNTYYRDETPWHPVTIPGDEA